MCVLSKLEDLISAVQSMPHFKSLKQLSFLLLLDEVTVYRSNVFQSILKTPFLLNLLVCLESIEQWLLCHCRVKYITLTIPLT